MPKDHAVKSKLPQAEIAIIQLPALDSKHAREVATAAAAIVKNVSHNAAVAGLVYALEYLKAHRG